MDAFRPSIPPIDPNFLPQTFKFNTPVNATQKHELFHHHYHYHYYEHSHAISVLQLEELPWFVESP